MLGEGHYSFKRFISVAGGRGGEKEKAVLIIAWSTKKKKKH